MFYRLLVANIDFIGDKTEAVATTVKGTVAAPLADAVLQALATRSEGYSDRQELVLASIIHCLSFVCDG